MPVITPIGFIAALLLLTAGISEASQELCQRNQLQAAASLCRTQLTCSSHETSNPARDVTPCRSKSLATATTAFDKALQKEQSNGGHCRLADAATTVMADWQDRLLGSHGVNSDLLLGFDAARPANNKLYAGLLNSAASACSQTLMLHAGNVLRPDSVKLAAALARARDRFMKDSAGKIQRARKKGLAYSGLEAGGLADSIQGYAEYVVTATTADPNHPVNHRPTGTVSISGTPRQGAILTAVQDLADPDGPKPLVDLTYQWLADGVAIGGATGSALTLGETQVGHRLSVTVSYTDALGNAEAVTSQATDLIANVNDPPVGTVSIDGMPMLGATLTANPQLADLDGPTPLSNFSYQWFLVDQPIPRATNPTYVPTSTDVGKSLLVVVGYRDGHGYSESVASAATATVTPGAVPDPDVVFTGNPLSYSVFRAIIPQTLTITTYSNAVALDRAGCRITLWPPVPANGTLEEQALQILTDMFANYGGVVGDIAASPLDDYFHLRGVNADGWPFEELQGELLEAGSKRRSGEHVRILLTNLGDQVAAMIGWQASYYPAYTNYRCISEEGLEPYEWSAIAYTLSFPDFPSPTPSALRDDLVGGWFGAKTGQYISLGWEDIYSDNGQHSDLVTAEEWQTLNSAEVLDKFSTWMGNGFWSAQANLLSIWPNDSARPATTRYFRIWEERNTAEPTGWRKTMRKLGTCGDDHHLCEGWADKE